jgi:hypothetical protein
VVHLCYVLRDIITCESHESPISLQRLSSSSFPSVLTASMVELWVSFTLWGVSRFRYARTVSPTTNQPKTNKERFLAEEQNNSASQVSIFLRTKRTDVNGSWCLVNWTWECASTDGNFAVTEVLDMFTERAIALTRKLPIRQLLLYAKNLVKWMCGSWTHMTLALFGWWPLRNGRTFRLIFSTIGQAGNTAFKLYYDIFLRAVEKYRKPLYM